MKKVYVIFLTMIMLLSLVGCGGKSNSLTGTWEAHSGELDGVRYTIAELEAMGDDTFSNAQIVIKDGGKAYVSDNTDGRLVDWEETEDGIKLGNVDCSITEGMISFEYGQGIVYFEKISDSQVVGDADT